MESLGGLVDSARGAQGQQPAQAQRQQGRFLICNRLARAVVEGQIGRSETWVFPSPKPLDDHDRAHAGTCNSIQIGAKTGTDNSAPVDSFASISTGRGHPVDDGDAMTLIPHMPEAFVEREDSEEARGRVAGGHLTLDYPTDDWGCLDKLSLS